jgi:CheY-like chemotaxis protein
MKPYPLQDKKILLVDDNEDGLLVRRLLLEELGYEVEVAGSGETGLKLVEKTSFDVVVTDFRMPEMDGIEFIKRARAVRPAIRTILLSGFVDPLGLNEENTGADAVIPKSSNEAAHLTRSVKRLLNKQPARRPPASQRGVLRQRASAR